MVGLLFLVPLLPFLGFLVLLVGGGRLPRRAVEAIGVGSVALSFAVAVLVAIGFAGLEGESYRQTLWRWMATGGFSADIGLWLDPLSLVMMLVVTGVGALILLYSVGFLRGEAGARRYFAAMTLFVASMLVLVLADNLLFLYLGWEGVGLCSYLLIGFWYREPANGAAARKAFLVTRIGDAALLLGLVLIVASLGTLDIPVLQDRAPEAWTAGSTLPVAAAALLLAGAVGKSAQLPLQVWLPDAMAGPSPVSALIHAATMVTAGVYLIARMHGLYALAPAVQTAVAAIGALTLLLAAISALGQSDIKRVLAWSTISQIGYMVMALGAGAWGAAIFHFMTHAFFKALLFLAAGLVILRLHEEHDIRRMGGLAMKLPVSFAGFLAGAASLAALPVVTAGAYSKDLILWQVAASTEGGLLLWLAGAIGAVLTALYIFKAVFLVFFGPMQTAPEPAPASPAMLGPIVVLAVLAVFGGGLAVPAQLAGTLPAPPLAGAPGHPPLAFALVSAALPLLGLAIAWALYVGRRGPLTGLAASRAVARAAPVAAAGFGFDALYERLFVRPWHALARTLRDDPADRPAAGLAGLSLGGYRLLRETQTGRVRWYAASLAGGMAAALALGVLS
ncbi:MAG: NADH-quinone oxidoreductase subunit L [Alphaproteobacteria bacterium]|jgi:NADH-quinone oxidoreductase subunit L|nr:NADH-quinone oxidoreductase subunit L [Alphaproteobacteria bacterium]